MNNAIPFRAVMDVLVRLESEAAGGAPVCDETGRCIGGVGISGRKPQEDAELAERLAQKLMGKE